MTRLALSLAMTLGILAGCVSQGGNDLATTDDAVAIDTLRESEGGIGGTGAPERQTDIAGGDETEGGIGGTGIFGTVTAFGSIVVNGLIVDFDEDAVQARTSRLGRELPLSVGSAVLVEARTAEDGWVAERVSLFLPVVGPVSAIDSASGRLAIMDTQILLEGDAVITDRRGYEDGKVIGLDAIAPGDRLAVSGLWKGGDVVASRIDRLEDDGSDSLRGLLLPTEDGAVVGGTVLDRSCCGGVDAPAFVNLEGDYQDGRFGVDRLDMGPALLFGEGIERLVVEAFLARDPDGEGFHLSGFGIPADQSASIVTEPGVRSLFVGAYDDRFLIRRSIPLPSDPPARDDALRSLGDVTSSD